MKIRQFINSINQIRCSEHIQFLSGTIRHLAWQFRRLRKNFPVELNISRSKMIVKEPSGVHALVNSMGIYDFNNMNLIQLVLQQSESRVFFDVGANIGSYTLVASEIPTAKIVGFEPHPETFKELKQNIELNKRTNVTLMNVAVSDHKGDLILSDEGTSKSSINRVIEHSQAIKSIRVQSKTLDQVCEELNVHPHIVKIDVEGHEPKVLAGFQKSICDAMLLLVERGEKYNLSEYFDKNNFAGPFYFHFLKRAFLKIPQRRAEDSVFINRSFISYLNQMGLHVA